MSHVMCWHTDLVSVLLKFPTFYEHPLWITGYYRILLHGSLIGQSWLSAVKYCCIIMLNWIGVKFSHIIHFQLLCFLDFRIIWSIFHIHSIYGIIYCQTIIIWKESLWGPNTDFFLKTNQGPKSQESNRRVNVIPDRHLFSLGPPGLWQLFTSSVVIVNKN